MEYLKKNYSQEGDISKITIVDETTKQVTDFYKVNPFPNYKSNDNKATILEKGNKNFLASQFKKFIGYGKNVLEVGCGTGQLSIYFSIATNNNVVGLDPTIFSVILLKLVSSLLNSLAWSVFVLSISKNVIII